MPASLHVVSWTAAGPVRVALFASGTRLIVLTAIALALTVLAMARRGAFMRRHAWIMAPLCLLWLWAVPYLPWLPERLPVLLVLSGPIRWVIAAVAVAAAALRWFMPPPFFLSFVSSWWPLARSRIAVFVVSLALYAGFGVINARAVGPGGDEPHYLIISQSLLADGDLKIENNHQRREYRSFFGGELRPDYMKRGLNGEIYSIHAPGLPILLLPAYAMAGYIGTVLLICVIAALTALAIFDLANAVAGPRAALITWAATCLTVPFVPHGWLVFPEMPGALVVAWGALWLWRPVERRVSRWLWRGVAFALLPWLHTKFVIFLVMFGAALVWRAWSRPKAVAAFLAPIAIAIAAWLSFFYVLYGSLNPEAPYGNYTEMYVLAKNIPRGLLGLMFDQKFGLLFYSPVYVFAIAGCWLILRRQDLRLLGAVLLLVAAAYVGNTTRLYMWWGGSSAPARFLVPIVPCVGPMVALAVAAVRGRVARTLLGLSLLVSVVVALAGAAWPERFLLFSEPRGYARLLETIQSGAPLTFLLPSFTDENWLSPLKSLFPLLAVGGIALGVTAAASRSPRLGELWLGTLACVTLLLTAGLAAGKPTAEAREDLVRTSVFDLLWRYNAEQHRPFEYAGLTQIDERRLRDVAVATFQHYPVEAFALPQGGYEARVWFSGALQREGEIVVSSRGRIVLGRTAGTFSNPAVVPFELPVAVGRLGVDVADQALAAKVTRVDIAPTAFVPQSAREPRLTRAVEAIADRPGAYLVYVDEHAYPEGGTFWTRSTEPSTVLVVPGSASRIVLTLHLGPQGGDVRVSGAGKDTTVRVEANQTAEVQLAVPNGLRLVPITIQSPTSFRPSAVDRSSDDDRTLGCQVRVDVR